MITIRKVLQAHIKQEQLKMSFKFDFQDDDIEAETETQTQQFNATTNNGTNQFFNPLDEMDATIANTPLVQAPKIVDVGTVLSSLVGVRFTFDIFQTPIEGITLYRREVFDVKHQLMQEEEEANATSASSSSELEILIGGTNEDLRQFVYEGGLKSWECSIDLVDYLSTASQNNLPSIAVEIGCGTSLPTEYIFIEYLKTYCLDPNNSASAPGLKLVLTDYNESVLRLVSVPNMIIAWAKTIYGAHWNDTTVWETQLQGNFPTQEDELTVTPELLQAFSAFCAAYKIEINLLSGSWCRSFQNLIHPLIYTQRQENTLIMSSETIYQPQTLPVISETLIDFQQHHTSNPQLGNQVILVAAKDIYFGVGGSIIDFTNYLDKRNSQYEVMKVNAGLKRSIVIMK